MEELLKSWENEEETVIDESLCEHCEIREGEYRLNPYYHDVHNTELYQMICSECYENLLGDI